MRAYRAPWLLRLCALAALLELGLSFCGQSQVARHLRRQVQHGQVASSPAATARYALDLDLAGQGLAGLAESSLAMSFSDQAGNINGVLFQASLPAYLAFLYFLKYEKNNTPPLVFFGFAFLLAFVFLTIPAGVISKNTFQVILADSDWLHGSAESLLSVTNVLIVLGFRGALTQQPELADSSTARSVAGLWFAAVVVTLALGVPLGFEAHTPFLANLGAWSVEEPVNALSIPTWIVHWSTVFEFLIAMSLAWTYADAVGNPKWKGLTWGMFPSSISSVFALTFHVFYNQIPWILTGQAVCTFVGNCTLALASYRIAASNGWTLAELDPRPAVAKFFESSDAKEGNEGSEGSGSEGFDASKVSPAELTDGPLLIAEVVLLTLSFAYGTKYGELGFAEIFQSPDSNVAAALVVLLPVALIAYVIYSQSPDLRNGQLPVLAPVSEK